MQENSISLKIMVWSSLKYWKQGKIVNPELYTQQKYILYFKNEGQKKKHIFRQ